MGQIPVRGQMRTGPRCQLQKQRMVRDGGKFRGVRVEKRAFGAPSSVKGCDIPAPKIARIAAIGMARFGIHPVQRSCGQSTA